MIHISCLPSSTVALHNTPQHSHESDFMGFMGKKQNPRLYHYLVQLYSLYKWAIFNSISPLITPCNQFHSALISFCLRNLYVSQYPQCIILDRNNFKIIFYQLGSDTFIPPSLVTKTFKIPSPSLAIVKNNPAS